MNFIKNIILMDKDRNFTLNIKTHLSKMSKKFNIYLIHDRGEFAEIASSKSYEAVFLHSSISKNDIMYILNFYALQSKQNEINTKVFITSKRFELFREIFDSSLYKNIVILPLKTNEEEIAKTISYNVFGKKIDNSNSSVDLEFINIFIIATRAVFTEMGQCTKITNDKPILQSSLNKLHEFAIASKIVMSNEFFKGTFFICFPKKTFLKFYETAVFEECLVIDDENKDFAAELANIIYGQAKKVFAASGYSLDMVIPSIHDKNVIDHSNVILVPFTCDLGPFHVAIAINMI
jgi:CheY-specific phosphatase CheX